MAVHMPDEGFRPRVRDLDGPARLEREEAGVRLHRQVLSRAERAADAGHRQADLVAWQTEHAGQLLLVDVQPLRGDVEVHPAFAVRDGEAGLRPQRRLVLHPDHVLAGHDDVGPRPLISMADPNLPRHVAAGVQAGRIRAQGSLRVCERLEHLVVDADLLGSLPAPAQGDRRPRARPPRPSTARSRRRARAGRRSPGHTGSGPARPCGSAPPARPASRVRSATSIALMRA